MVSPPRIPELPTPEPCRKRHQRPATRRENQARKIATRIGQWKLLAAISAKREIQSAQRVRVVHVVVDIAEARDLSAEQAGQARQRQARLKTSLETVVDPSPRQAR